MIPLSPPNARREPVVVTQLGRTRTDDYAWMKDLNWQRVLRDPSLLRADIREHLLAENAYADAALACTADLQQALFEEMRGRIKADESSVPMPDGPWEYYSRYDTGAQHPRMLRRPTGGGDELLLLDIAAAAKPHAYFRIGGTAHSADHAFFAWAEDNQGSEVYTIRVIEVSTGTQIGEPIDNATGSFVFSPCGRHLFWTLRDDNGRPSAVLRRPVGGAAADDTLVYREPDAGFFMNVEVAASRDWIVLQTGNRETSEALVVPASNPAATPRVFAPREPGVRYDIDHQGDRFVVLTNADGAVDYKLVEVTGDDTSRAMWRDLLPHRPGRYVSDFMLFAGYVVHAERADANDTIVVTDRATGFARPVAVDDEAYSLRMAAGYEFATRTMRYTYESPREPRQVLDLDMATGERTLRKTQEIPSGHDASQYVVKRLHAMAADGAQVPVTLLARRDALLSGPCPTLLHGYGAYGIPMMPSFNIGALNLVNRGWIWATAHVRGGTEKGWGWFLGGRGKTKANTFTDFTACAEHLIAAGHSKRGRIVGYGGSAGGLLIGAVLNMRPDIWAGMVAVVPFVDALNTMSDTSLPLTPPEWPEWGNPLEDVEAYDLIASYSPYEQVGPRAYPPVLALAGLSDPRVTYWEPAKWVAKLRAETIGDAPILLRTVMEGGHGGRSGRFDYLKEPALIQAFALWAMERAQSAV